MLFNSHFFIFIFLPVTVIGYYLLGARKRPAAAGWVTLASLFFYGWWNPKYLILIIFSMIFNYAVGSHLRGGSGAGPNKPLLTFGVFVNLALIGYFKYANFFINTIDAVSGAGIALDAIVLPLAISFFTFQQIAYLTDAYSGITEEHSFSHYALFVTFFPQLIAGPIVHHREMMSQFTSTEEGGQKSDYIAIGLTIFFMGLFKKVIIADNIAKFATPVFNAALGGAEITLFEAWGGALSYTFQLYFDFSGYSDMAVGLGYLFGIRLPLNFNSPYKAVNIIDFWRRWHITLSRFFRDYLYIPLGGSRVGVPRTLANLFITMLLGGLWHGAGWTFVFWGGLHGVYLAANHAFRLFRKNVLGHDLERSSRAGRCVSTVVTFLVVVVSWVFFRAEDFTSAKNILMGMCGLNGIAFHKRYAEKWSNLAPTLKGMGIKFTEFRLFEGDDALIWLLILLIIVWAAPNVNDIMRDRTPAIGYETPTGRELIRWRPSLLWAVITAAISIYTIICLTQVSEFLYFQF